MDFPFSGKSVSPSGSSVRKRSASISSSPLVDLGSVVKSPLDHKEYKVVQLQNGLRVTLISTSDHQVSSKLSSKHEIDCFNKTQLGIQAHNQFGDSLPERTPGVSIEGGVSKNKPVVNITPAPDATSPPSKSAKLINSCQGPSFICVTVGAGSYHNPNSVSGLAHLVQHLVLLGSTNHPEPNKLCTKVFENGGVLNATTSGEQTSFYFSCASQMLEECTEILVDCLMNPLFRESDIRQKINGIDWENDSVQLDEVTRISNFLKSRAKQDHPFHTSHLGNQTSLNRLDIQSKSRAWHNRYYKANYMTVCIQAPMTIENLEKFLIDHFSGLPSAVNEAPSPYDELVDHGPPFSPNQFETCYVVAPLTSITAVVISWSLPLGLWSDYKSKPVEYLKLMLENTCPGGLKHILRKKGWMTEWNNLCVSFFPSPFSGIFSVFIQLTDKGYQDKELLLKVVFSFLKMLTFGGIRARYWEEMKRTSVNKFHFLESEQILQNLLHITVDMQQQNIPPTDILTSKLLTNWCPEAIQECLKLMTPRKANYVLVAPSNKQTCPENSLSHGFQYTKQDILEECYKGLEDTLVYSNLHLPLDGAFLANEISCESGSDEHPPHIGQIYKSDKLVVTHLLNENKEATGRISRVPIAYYSIHLSSISFKMSQGALEYWARLLADKMVQKTSHRFDHLYTFNVEVNNSNVSVHLGGPRCHLPELLGIVTQQIFNFGGGGDSVEEDINFAENLKNDLIREYKNEAYHATTFSEDIVAFLLEENYLNLFDIQNQIKNISLKEGNSPFAQLIQNFRKNLIITAELKGAVTNEDTQQIVVHLRNMMEDEFDVSNKPISERPKQSQSRAKVLPRGTSNVCIKAFHPAYTTSVVTNFYQVDLWEGNHAKELLLRLFRLMNIWIVNKLRENFQNGSFVKLMPYVSSGNNNDSSQGFSLTMSFQPGKSNIENIDHRIDTALREFYVDFLTTEETRGYLERHFRLNIHVYDELIRFYKENFLKEGVNFRKLSVQLEGFVPGMSLGLSKQAGGPYGSQDTLGKGDAIESLRELEYLDVDEIQKLSLELEGIKIIMNVDNFKKELEFLPSNSSN